MHRFLFRSAIVLTAGALVISGTYLTKTLLTATPLTEGCTVQVNGEETSLEVSQAENASLIAALAVRHNYPRQAATVALTAAYQESGLQNLDHGDRDSVGLFQQRPSQGWGSRAQISDPYYSTQTFYDRLRTIENYQRLPAAQAAQLVQNSADGTAYAQHEQNAEALSDAFTGRTEASFSCRLAAEPTPSPVAGRGRSPELDRPDENAPVPSSEARGPGDASAANEQDWKPADKDVHRPPEGGDQAPAGTDVPAAARAEQSEPSGQPDPDSARDTDGRTSERHETSATGDVSGREVRQDAAGRTQTSDEDEQRSPAEAVRQELEHAFGSRAGEPSRTRQPGAEQPGSEQPGANPLPQSDKGTGSAPSAQDGTSGAAPPGEPSTDQTPADPESVEPDDSRGATTADPQVSDDGKQVRVAVDDEQIGWAIAHWAVANTQRLGITEVDYDGRSWAAEQSSNGWSSGGGPGAETVRIGLG